MQPGRSRGGREGLDVSDGAPLPDHVRGALLRGRVVRAMREAVTAPGNVALVAGRGASVPELPAGIAWHSVDEVRVAGVPLPFAQDLAGFRASAAGVQLATDPPARCRWCLYLDAGLRCAVVPFPVRSPTAPPSTPPEAA